MVTEVRRRSFIAGAGSLIAWTVQARAQEAPQPVIGFLRNTTEASSAEFVAAFRQGLAERGFVEGQNVRVEYRWTDDRDERLPALAADLVARQVGVIVAGGGSVTARAAKAATQTIPIVFELGGDPVKLGLVPNLNRPGGNVTGIALFANTIMSKRVQILLELVADARAIGILSNPANPNAAAEANQAKEAGRALGKDVLLFTASQDSDIESSFGAMAQSGIAAVIVTASPLFVARRDQIISLAGRYRLPAMFPFSSFARAGGLVSYGDSLAYAFRQTGSYAGRILQGEKPGDLPVVQPTKFELVINRRTANALKLNIPATVLATADEVIE
jgi:putative ABC transport system substrate-binding protein